MSDEYSLTFRKYELIIMVLSVYGMNNIVRSYVSMKYDFKLYTENLPAAKALGYLPPPMPEHLDMYQQAFNRYPYFKDLWRSFENDLEALGEPVPQSLKTDST